MSIIDNADENIYPGCISGGNILIAIVCTFCEDGTCGPSSPFVLGTFSNDLTVAQDDIDMNCPTACNAGAFSATVCQVDIEFL